MTRAEEILKAARDYVDGVISSSPSDVIHSENGAKWADEHPNLESLWHDASEEPKDNSEIVIVDTGRDFRDIDYVSDDYDGWEFCIAHYNIKIWAYTRDLLPKGGEG